MVEKLCNITRRAQVVEQTNLRLNDAEGRVAIAILEKTVTDLK